MLLAFIKPSLLLKARSDQNLENLLLWVLSSKWDICFIILSTIIREQGSKCNGKNGKTEGWQGMLEMMSLECEMAFAIMNSVICINLKNIKSGKKKKSSMEWEQLTCLHA